MKNTNTQERTIINWLVDNQNIYNHLVTKGSYSNEKYNYIVDDEMLIIEDDNNNTIYIDWFEDKVLSLI